MDHRVIAVDEAMTDAVGADRIPSNPLHVSAGPEAVLLSMSST